MNSPVIVLTAGLMIIVSLVLARQIYAPLKQTLQVNSSIQSDRNTLSNLQGTSPSSSVSAIPTPIAYSLMKIKMLKDVGEAYIDHFGLTDQDFALMQAAGVNLIEGNFDICASDKDVNFFLQESEKHGLKVVMPAGSGEVEWGFVCDQEPYPIEQKPVWQKAQVQAWINKWKGNPVIYAWDTSNEAGSVFPNASEDRLDKYLTLAQLQQAYYDVKAADPQLPVLIRMNGWYFYDNEDNFFTQGNPFGPKAADIVMINAYSNVKDYFPDFVSTVTSRGKYAVQQINPQAQIIIALGVWQELPLWYKPSPAHLQHDLDQLETMSHSLLGVAYFKYGVLGGEWYLPSQQDGADLWQIISQPTNK
ncbi:MAG: hypothetical protein M1607_03035 [Patescibacteria group bacterium]|nr:hypothetical protein [Patescibacteria group bacterium]